MLRERSHIEILQSYMWRTIMRDLTYDELESVSGDATNYNSSKSNVYIFEPTTIAKANRGGWRLR
jgi:hypothetical protein